VVIEALAHINKELGKTIILVTHDPLIASFCSRIIFLKDGEIMGDIRKTGTNDEFYQQVLENMKGL
jgi:ABC-type lipoprotein export system ATPase subunit